MESFTYRVTTLKLKNKKFHFKSLTRKMNERIVILNNYSQSSFFVEMKYYTIQNCLKRIHACNITEHHSLAVGQTKNDYIWH